jgi:hypothetical protein
MNTEGTDVKVCVTPVVHSTLVHIVFVCSPQKIKIRMYTHVQPSKYAIMFAAKRIHISHIANSI